MSQLPEAIQPLPLPKRGRGRPKQRVFVPTPKDRAFLTAQYENPGWSAQQVCEALKLPVNWAAARKYRRPDFKMWVSRSLSELAAEELGKIDAQLVKTALGDNSKIAVQAINTYYKRQQAPGFTQSDAPVNITLELNRIENQVVKMDEKTLLGIVERARLMNPGLAEQVLGTINEHKMIETTGEVVKVEPDNAREKDAMKDEHG